MIAEFVCCKCNSITEEYFSTYDLMKDAFIKKKIKCNKCGETKLKRIFGSPGVKQGGEIPGYEKANKDKMTIGKAFDSYHSKWV